MSDDKKKGLKGTLNLPQTEFAMKANLPQNEPLRLAKWESSGLYEQIRAARAGAPKYILHDGPPYANGAIHLGHALNKCIKDFVVKTKTMAGFDAPYVPGWDCHGLPIEIKVDEKLGGKKLEMDPVAVRKACREYAGKYLDLQRTQFKRLGVFGRWDKPYATMDFPYEASILETFYGFYEKGFVYKGLKPVYWCSHDHTALAEAEVEYEMHTSPSVYVRYALHSLFKQGPASTPLLSPATVGKRVYAIIWTTTPWTLPASMAIAFNPDIDYVGVEVESGEIYIVAEELLGPVSAACNFKNPRVVAHFKGSVLDKAQFLHPFLDRAILGVNADYVTTEQGTGAVHTAPSHGPDDFATGVKYGLPLTCNVDAQGKLRNYDGQPFDGLFVDKANHVIKKLLQERGALMGEFDLNHSYPHCWRCHHPLIFRATEQWFIGMETPVLSPKGGVTFRERALEEIGRVVWDPEWGEERISNMIATRPDWCISRQRIWGVPIAVFLCEKCHEPLNDEAINASVVELFARDGADAWYSKTVAELLPAGTKCPDCGGTEFRKEMDILDVWFESGASWHAVLDVEPELHWPADLYTEGGDQHRGWFHSSLLSSVGIRDAAPYRMVATSGWTLDEQGRAFSKSLGNGVDPVDIANRLGAEIVRLWVASVDFREDVAASENLMQRVSENYRKLRNTLRFLLSNLWDFDPAKDAVEWEAMQPLDQYILARTAELDAAVRKAYDEFEFHRAYQALNEFTNSDLSALYLDVVKDRLYTFAPQSRERRSAQTAMWRIVEAMTRLIAPILSFTAEEVWEHLPKVEGRAESVHVALFPEILEIVPGTVANVEADWEKLFEARETVMTQLEMLRVNKNIGKGLDASVRVIATEGSDLGLILSKYKLALPEFFNVSQVTVQMVASTTNEAALAMDVNVASGAKCARCWRVVTDVGEDPRWPEVCTRCAAALEAIGYPPISEVAA